MKGLILKDLYALWKYYKSFVLVACAFLFLGVVSDRSLFYIPFANLFITILPIGFLSMDEKSGWSVFCDAMPVSRAQVVSSKYLLCLIFLLAEIAFSSVITLMTGFNMETFLVSLVVCGCVLLTTAIMLLCAFAFGTDKGRYVGIVLASAVTLVMTYGGGGTPDLSWLRYLPFAGLVLFPISWLASIPLYDRHREKQ